MIRVPKTDEEVIKEINEYSDDLLRRILLGIFECRRGMGTDVLTAWEYTLNAHIECCIDKEEGCSLPAMLLQLQDLKEAAHIFGNQTADLKPCIVVSGVKCNHPNLCDGCEYENGRQW